MSPRITEFHSTPQKNVTKSAILVVQGQRLRPNPSPLPVDPPSYHGSFQDLAKAGVGAAFITRLKIAAYMEEQQKPVMMQKSD